PPPPPPAAPPPLLPPVAGASPRDDRRAWRQAKQRLGSLAKPFSAWNSWSRAENVKDAPQSTQVSVLSVNATRQPPRTIWGLVGNRAVYEWPYDRHHVEAARGGSDRTSARQDRSIAPGCGQIRMGERRRTRPRVRR